MKIKCLFFVLLCLSLAGAAEWTAAGANWSRGQDVSLSIPEGLQGKEDENGTLTVQHPSGTLYVSLIYVPTESDAAQVLKAMSDQVKKTIPDAKLSEPKGGKLPNGNSLEVQDGPGTIKGTTFDVTIGTIHNSKKFLCFFALLKQSDLESLNPMMDTLMGSVKIN